MGGGKWGTVAGAVLPPSVEARSDLRGWEGSSHLQIPSPVARSTEKNGTVRGGTAASRLQKKNTAEPNRGEALG